MATVALPVLINEVALRAASSPLDRTLCLGAHQLTRWKASWLKGWCAA